MLGLKTIGGVWQFKEAAGLGEPPRANNRGEVGGHAKSDAGYHRGGTDYYNTFTIGPLTIATN
jgi:hypothetical protein